MQKLIFTFISTVLITISLSAQFDEILNRANFPVTVNNQTVLSPWAGGINSPQFSTADLNDDGIEDLYVFDRESQLHLTWLQTSEGYVFTPELADNFPGTKDFALLRDYDGDGIADLFAKNQTIFSNGITSWKGAFFGGKLTFTPYPDATLLATNNGGQPQVIITAPDNLPDLNDIDGDGDLDILVFDEQDGFVKYYQNRSVQMGYAADSLLFTKVDNCWGKFFYGFLSTALLSSTPDQCYTGFSGNDGGNTLHAGISMTSRDLNGDGVRELFVSAGETSELLLLENGNTAESAWMNDKDETFPSSDTPVNILHGQGVFQGDFDNDGLSDMVVASATEDFVNYNCAWFYKNTGTETNPTFSLQQTNFLTETMLDFGSNAQPTFVDVNGDGLLDLVIGTNGKNEDNNVSDARLILFLNTGTTTNPAYTLTNEDWLNFSQFTVEDAYVIRNFSPTFGDLDSDGDLDLLVGCYEGSLFYAENTGIVGGSLQYDAIIPNWQNFDVGLNSVPQILDLDDDGLKDLVIGERNGTLNFMKNIGTPIEPQFEEEENQAPNISYLGQVDAAADGEGFGFSAPRFVKTDEEWILYLGTRSQGIQVYGNINSDDLSEPFTLLAENYGGVNEGHHTYAAFADLTGDDELEMVVGNQRGGLAMYTTPLVSAIVNERVEQKLKIFPNPVQAVLNIVSIEENSVQDYLIYNAIGQLVQRGNLRAANTQISVGHLTAGIYFLEVGGEVERFVRE